MILYKENTSLQLQFIEESEILKSKIEIQDKNKNICNVYMEKVSDYMNHVLPNSTKASSQFENTLIALKNICDNVISDLQNLNELKKCLYNIDTNSNDELRKNIDTYNNSYMQIMQKIDIHDVEMQDFTATVLKNYAFVFPTNKTTSAENTKSIKSSRDVSDTSDTNVLIISEKDQIAYLPYKLEEVEEFLNSKENKKPKYSSIQEIIENKYTVHLSSFKFPTISRFREVFNLVRKEKGLLEAFEAAVELMTNFNLNPIIVRACRSVQELNIFVDCLEESETEKFPCFEIEYKIAPVVV